MFADRGRRRVSVAFAADIFAAGRACDGELTSESAQFVSLKRCTSSRSAVRRSSNSSYFTGALSPPQ